jgi:hypothetical protein
MPCSGYTASILEKKLGWFLRLLREVVGFFLSCLKVLGDWATPTP